MLLKYTPEIHLKTKSGKQTALDYAREQGHTEIVKTLEQHFFN